MKSPFALAATHGTCWLPWVRVLTWNSVARGAPALEKRRAKTPPKSPSWTLVQATTKSPSPSAASAGRYCTPGVKVLTWNSLASGLPALEKRRPNTPLKSPS